MSSNLIIKIVLVLTLVSAPASTWGSATALEKPKPLPLTSGWQYRWGDSPVDTTGTPTWLTERPDSAWNTFPKLDWPEGRDGQEWIWYRITLPPVRFARPALYLPNVATAFEVYIGEDLVYQFGTLRRDIRNKYTVTEVHVIPLPADYPGKTVSVRVFSDVFVIGIDATSDTPLIGSEEGIIRRLFITGLESTALGFLFIFAGLFSLLTFVIRFRENLFAPLSFTAFSICLGLFYISTQSIAQFAIKSQVLKLYAITVSFFLFPIGMFGYLQATIFKASSAAVRRIVWGMFYWHAGLAAVLLALDLFDVVAIPIGMRTYNILFAVTVPISLVITLRHALRGSTEARIAVWGFAVFGFTGFADLLQGLQVIPYWHWISEWGALAFVGCLGWVLERQFTESHRQLRKYSVQLKEKSEQLEEYSRTLEEKVIDRTRNLDEKNRQLEGTLKELKDTQQQLIIKEKLASLGSLVAGVAHEVNNPIGAVISASDVSSRCVEVVRGFVQETAEDGNSKVRKASDLIVDNNRVISEAAQRVSEIVKVLKNFARLDEAEFQKANIHDGIDSTLTLVKHLVKDRIVVVKEYGDVPDLMVFPNQLNQVFMNLIVNAIDAIDDEGTITIKTYKDSLNAYISVADTGRGIPADNIRRVFDPGFTTKGVGVGTGLGLSISYNIVQRHSGALDVESEPGKGTKFTIVLPLRRVTSANGSEDA